MLFLELALHAQRGSKKNNVDYLFVNLPRCKYFLFNHGNIDSCSKLGFFFLQIIRSQFVKIIDAIAYRSYRISLSSSNINPIMIRLMDIISTLSGIFSA